MVLSFKQHSTHVYYSMQSLLMNAAKKACYLSSMAYFLLSFPLLAQVPERMSYQVVIRNNANSVVVNQSIGIRISLLQGSVSGSPVFVETHNALTNENGLLSLEIGGGNLISGNLADILWNNGPFFIKTETDISGGTNYTLNSVQQLLSVPYALHSGNGITGVSSAGDTLFFGNGNHLIVPGISAANTVVPSPNTPHTCGALQVHNPSLTYGSMTDQDGNVYKTITIGTQEWMAENLKASHYRNGNPIPVVTSNSTWSGLSSGACSWYNNDSASYDCPYGKIYNWYAVNDSRSLCPSGWHEPSDAEWNSLVGTLDPAYIQAILGSQSLTAGGILKSTGNFYWSTPNQDGSNTTGFSALPGGVKGSNGAYGSLGNVAGFWTKTAFNTAGAWTREIYTYSGSIERYNYDKRLGYYMRCVRD